MSILLQHRPLGEGAKCSHWGFVGPKRWIQGTAEIARYQFHWFANGIFCGRRGSRAFPRRLSAVTPHPHTLALAKSISLPAITPHRFRLQPHRTEPVSLELEFPNPPFSLFNFLLLICCSRISSNKWATKMSKKAIYDTKYRWLQKSPSSANNNQVIDI